jgi:hypothetical protein
MGSNGSLHARMRFDGSVVYAKVKEVFAIESTTTADL